MLIEQKIEVNGQKVTIIRTVDYPATATASKQPEKPPDRFSKEGRDMTNEEIAEQSRKLTQQQSRGSTSSSPRSISRVLIVRGGNIEELGTGGDLEDLGPGGNLASGLTLVFGPVNIECCRCHHHDATIPAENS
ncbi:MAG: hypothetical protein J0L64_26545 [Acidobacteria bacterium]|nr:hypothetical protein [Acidobacteriota bacterium]